MKNKSLMEPREGSKAKQDYLVIRKTQDYVYLNQRKEKALAKRSALGCNKL